MKDGRNDVFNNMALFNKESLLGLEKNQFLD